MIKNAVGKQMVEECVTQPSSLLIQKYVPSTPLVSSEQLEESVQNESNITDEKFESFADIFAEITYKANSSSQLSGLSRSKFEISDKLDQENAVELNVQPMMEKFEGLLSQNSSFDTYIFSNLIDTCELTETGLDHNHNVNTSEGMEYTIDENNPLCQRKLMTRRILDGVYLENREKLPRTLFEKAKTIDECSVLEVCVNSDSKFELRKVLLTTERPFHCDICGLTFKRKDHVRSHKKWVHLGIRNKDLKCEKCGKMLKSNDGLEQHMRRHLNLKPFQCKECVMAFYSRRCLLKHSKIHYNTPLPVADGIYKCMQCLSKYSSEKDLQIHHNWHQLLLVCDICLERFQFRKQLLCHKRVHTAYHPYKCNTCSKTFRQNRSLQAHTLKCQVNDLSNYERNFESEQVENSSDSCKVSMMLDSNCVSQR